MLLSKGKNRIWTGGKGVSGEQARGEFRLLKIPGERQIRASGQHLPKGSVLSKLTGPHGNRGRWEKWALLNGYLALSLGVQIPGNTGGQNARNQRNWRRKLRSCHTGKWRRMADQAPGWEESGLLFGTLGTY